MAGDFSLFTYLFLLPLLFVSLSCEGAFNLESTGAVPKRRSTFSADPDIVNPETNALGPPVVKGWEKIPVSACTLSSPSASSVGPFKALLTLNNAGQIVAFEPVHVEKLCPLSPGSALYHVVCSDETPPDPKTVISRAAPDLTYRLSLEEIQVSGILPTIIATSLKTFVFRKEFKGTNPIATLFKWLYTRLEKRQPYTIQCDDRYEQRNPHFSYTSFWGEILQAAYEMKGFNQPKIPRFAVD